MKHEDLIEKLENLETPEIELPGHKQALKMALLSSGRFKERTIAVNIVPRSSLAPAIAAVMDWTKILAPISAALLLIAVVGFFNVIQPQLQIAQAKELAMNDPQVQEFMEEYGLEITEVKLQNGEAFVLLTPEPVHLAASGPDEELPPRYILKVDLLEKEVNEFGEIDEDINLEDINLEDIDFVKFGPPGGGS